MSEAGLTTVDAIFGSFRQTHIELNCPMVAVKIIGLLQCVDAGPGIMVRPILVNGEASVVGHFCGMHQPRRRELASGACENPIK